MITFSAYIMISFHYKVTHHKGLNLFLAFLSSRPSKSTLVMLLVMSSSQLLALPILVRLRARTDKR